MGRPTLTDVVEAERLLREGEMRNGRLVIDGNSSLAAYVCLIVILTEPTRLLIRRPPGEALTFMKWARGELLDRMPIEWIWRGERQQHPGARLSDAFRRLNLGAGGHEIVAGLAEKSVVCLRRDPTDILRQLHDSTWRALVESPPAFMLPSGNKYPLIRGDLTRQCMLLSYVDRRALIAAWKSGRDDDCTPHVRHLVTSVRALSSKAAGELAQALW